MGIISEDYIKRFNKLCGIITEGSIRNITVDSFLNDKFLTDFINGDITSDSYFFLSNYMDDVGIKSNDENYRETEEKIKKDPEFRKYVKDEMHIRIVDSIGDITKRIESNGDLIIYRVLAVDENWVSHLETQGKHLGVYWTWSESGGGVLHSHDPNKKYEAIVTAKINEKYVDWDTSLLQNIVLEGEAEITLFKNTPLKIIDIIIYDDSTYHGNPTDPHIKVSPSVYQNKTFYA